MASISAILSSVIGSSSVFGEAWQLHPNQQIRWPPQGHGVLAPDSPTVAPARRSPTISTTSVDTNWPSDDVRGPTPDPGIALGRAWNGTGLVDPRCKPVCHPITITLAKLGAAR